VDGLTLTGGAWALEGDLLWSVCKGLLAAFVFGQVIAWTYEATYRGLSYSRGFSHTLVLGSLGAVILVMAMEQSIVAGVGLFGVLSMVRFRNTLKAPRDLIFLLGSVTVGVASAVDALAVACLGTLAFCGAALWLHHGSFGSRAAFDGVLRLRLPGDHASDQALARLLERHCRRSTLLSVSEIAQGDLMEHTYQVKLWHLERSQDMLRELRQELHTQDVRLLMQDAALEY
jgi:hypothetical protein